ncbi:MAG: hypothetical protein IJD13_04910 [Oscillospiraceae bacterium]|nr:hypothetical protein [Oscillospiraceae bacterium]
MRKQQMVRNKKLLGITLAAVILALVLCGVNWRHFYRPEDRTPLEKGLVCYGGVSTGIDLSVRHADIIIEGSVIAKNTGDFTECRVRVKDVLFGQCESSVITLRLSGNEEFGIVKPRKNDKVILFVEEHLDSDTKEKYYCTVNAEKSIYVINPFGGGLFAFSTDEESTRYDGKNPSELKRDISVKMEEYASKEIGSNVGDALKLYLDSRSEQ